jgi:hypothetical protein
MGPSPNMSVHRRSHGRFHNRFHRNRGALILFACLMACLMACLLVAGCEKKQSPLVLSDLDEGETDLLTRLIILERAKSLALVDRPAGQALLDSLALAWGDSIAEETVAGAPTNATRAHAVGELFSRIFAAEHDSMLAHDGRRDLTAPLPDPPAPAEEIEPET